MEKRGAKIKLIVWSIVLILVLMMVVSLIVNGNLSGSFFGLMNDGEYKVIFDESFDVTDINNISVKGRSGKVNIYVTTDETIRVVQKAYENTADNERVKVEKVEDTLKIEQGRGTIRFFYIGIGVEDVVIDIYLPEKEFNKISAECTSGRITAENLVCNEIYLKLSSGQLKVNNVETKSAELNITSGNMNIDNIKTNNLKTKVSSGRIDINGEIKNIILEVTSGTIKMSSSIMPETIEGKVTSGNITIDIPENDGFDLECHKTSGTFKTDFEILSEFGSDNKNDINGRYKTGGSKVKLRITSGTIKLNKI